MKMEQDYEYGTGSRRWNRRVKGNKGRKVEKKDEDGTRG
jgi:hypothetical protein